MTPKERALEALEAIEKEVHNKIYVQPSKYLERIATIRAALTEPEWQPIDTAPRDGSIFLMYQPQDHTITTGNWMNETSPICPSSWFPLSAATHWLPLPQPPTKKESE